MNLLPATHEHALSRHELADLLGFASAAVAVAAALLLVFPLFHLLRAREAIEDLETDSGSDMSAEDRQLFEDARKDLKQYVRRRRKTATRVAVAGTVLLIVALVLLGLQGNYLFR
ncbi:MAG TPA: hypothetical protein VGD08_15655 [Stellaceae bacterium]